MRRLLVLFIVLYASGLIPPAASAQWQPNGVALSTAVGYQQNPAVVSDGAGGAIVTWYDSRSLSNYDIYAQRVNPSGVPLWTADGVVVCATASNQEDPVIVSDGAGGAIVVWHDYRSGPNIYAQRVNASGVPQWAADGVAICTAANNQEDPTITSDDAGGAIVAWSDSRGGVNQDIYAQRVNASGVPQWAADGVALCTAGNNQQDPTIVLDGVGGAIVTWQDYRSGANYDIYAQRVDASGAPQWTAGGVALSATFDNQYAPKIVLDNVGGAIVTWYDSRSGTNLDIYAQRVNTSGAPQWTADGVALCVAPNNQLYPTIVSDGAGGAIITWSDYRSGTNYDVYVQQVNVSGATKWPVNGIALCSTANNQLYPAIVSDGAGGAIVTWQDYRNGANYDIYAQRVHVSGVQWTADGVALCTAGYNQEDPTIVLDSAGGAIVTWQDYRSGANYDIYAHRVDGRYGYWGHPEPIVTSVADVPNDQGSHVAVNWTASGRDLPVPRTIGHYTIWRAVDALALAGAQPVGLTELAQVGRDTQHPTYIHVPSSDYYWELVGTQSAHGWAGYSFSASTRADSVPGDAGDEYFMIAAHDQSDDYVAFASNAMSGHSVDNLAPAAPLFLTAQRAGADVQLRWNRVRVFDLRDYSVYRATSSGVTPVPINFLSSSHDTVLVDSGAPTSALYYIVTAYDVHENQGAASNEASVGATTSIGNTPPITALSVLENMPNPFATTTTLRVGLPKASEVEIEVFDVGGRSVGSQRTAQLAAGWRAIAFDARDATGAMLPSGVYFYRVHAAGATITRKMVIAR